VHADSGEFFSSPWADLVAVGRTFGNELAYGLRKQLIVVSRLFAHEVDITTVDGGRFVGVVTSFEYDNNVGAAEVLIEPTDHVRFPRPTGTQSVLGANGSGRHAHQLWKT
jgi:hypothetical protein